MSQLQNLTQVFSNNDLVTAAKLNALVSQTTLTGEAVTAQAATTSGLTSADVVLGHQASTNALVQIPISTIRETGLSIKTQTIEPLTSTTLEIKTGASLTSGVHYPTDITIDSADGETNVMGKLVTLGNEGVYDREVVSGGNHRFKAATIVEGAPVTAKMTSIVGNPSITIQVFAASATAIPHGFSIGDVIDVVGPTAEFTGAFTIIASNFSTTSFMVTLPANASTAYNAVMITANRPSLSVKKLTNVERLRVTGATEFNGPVTFNGGSGFLVLKSIYEETLPSWVATVGGTFPAVVTTANFTKPANETWVFEIDGTWHMVKGWGAGYAFRYSTETYRTGAYLQRFDDYVGGVALPVTRSILHRWVVPSGTALSSRNVTVDVWVGSGSQLNMFRSTSISSNIITTGTLPSSKFRIYKYAPA